jgi:hypothetical protein
MRVKRGTLPSTREGGRLYVLLNTDPTTDPDRPHERGYDRTSELIATLREQLEAERQAHAEARRIIAGLVERMPQLEPPSDQRESPQTVEEEPKRAEPRPGTGATEVATEEPSEAEPSLLLERVTVVILSTLPLLYLFLADVVLNLPAGPAFGPWVALVAAMVLAGVVFPAVFGLRMGHKVSRLRFWRNVAPVAALILLVGLIGEFVVAGSILFYVIPSLVYSFAAILGNALRRRTREKLKEERPSDFPQEAATSGQRWTPRQQATVGLAGTIISALIGLVGTILAVMLQ